MFSQIDFESDIPIYQQIKNQIIKGIARGDLELGEDLPSVRQLASDIGINFHTVNKVYTQLKQEGWITVHRKSGAIVNKEFKVERTKSYIKQLKDTLEITLAEAYLRGVTQEEFIKMIDEIYRSFRREEK